jgi:hypothetical protein
MVLNEHLDVVLDRHGRTIILLDGDPFVQCTRLLINVKLDDTQAYDDISSIDEAVERQASIFMGRGFEPKVRQVTITPEEEFFGHCSNLQAWVDNGYDTRILHANISFNLLRALAEAGDEKAARVLDAELEERAVNASKMTATAIFDTFEDKQPFSPAVFEAFIRNPDPEVRIVVAAQAKLPAEVMDRLAADNEPAVRQAIAARLDLPESIVARLEGDADPAVRAALGWRTEMVKNVVIAYRGEILATVPASTDRLDLSRRHIESIAEIENLDRLVLLKSLILVGNDIERIDGLDSIVTLQSLSLKGNRITRIEGLDTLVNLRELVLAKNQIATIEGLDRLQFLNNLNLSKNRITKIEGLESLRYLIRLVLDDNLIETIEGLDNLPILTVLDLSGNRIAEIEGFTNPARLYRLDLSGNRIETIQGLERLRYLGRLNLAKNRIAKVEGLDRLRNLQVINLTGNAQGLAQDGWLAWPLRDT